MNPNNYDEDSQHDALDEYGKSKSLGEPDNCMVLRTSIIGPEIGQGFSLLEWVRKQSGKEIGGFTNHLWNGITTLQYAKVCEQIIEEGWYESGLFHIHSPRLMNKLELVTLIAVKYKVDVDIGIQIAKESIDRTMSSKKDLCSRLEIPDITEQIEDLY
jgi:dTDP-4-dehydrorhamnose reductase